MARRAPAAALMSLALLESCGSPTTPRGYPLVTGTYRDPLLWDIHFTLPDGSRARGRQCGGNIVIEEQNEAALRGSYNLVDPCTSAAGELTGQIALNGQVTLDLRSPTAFQTFEECTYVAGDRVWTGRIDGDELDMRIETTLDCVPAGRVSALRTARGSR